jgi:drug/metabolite transporter (DMT)-like permease
MGEADSKNTALGILLVTIAFLSFSLMSGFVKAASHAGISTQEIMLFQNAVALAVLAPWIARQGRECFAPRCKGLVTTRALLGVASMYAFFLAVRLVPLVNAVLLQNTIPLFIPLLSLLWLKRRISARTLISMVIGFIGVAMVLNPGRGFLRPGDLIALSAGFLSAVVTIIVGRLDDEGEKVGSIMFYYLAIAIVVTGIWSIHGWKMPHGVIWLYLLMAGVLYAAFQTLLILSMEYTTAVVIAPFIYLSVVFSGLIDWAVWDQVPDLLTVAGIAVVIAGAVFSTLHHKKGRPVESS